MVYIDRNGRVLERRPWDLARFKDILMGFWFVVVQFVITLLAPFMSDNANRSNNNSRRSGWGGGGPGGGPGGGTGRNNFPQRRPIGRVVNTSTACNIPGGGCAG